MKFFKIFSKKRNEKSEDFVKYPSEVELKINKIGQLVYQGRLEEALYFLNNELEKNSKILELWFYKTKILNDLKRYKESLDCCDRAIGISPNSVIVWCNKAYALISLRRFQDAIRCCDKALEIDKNFAEAWNKKGYALAQLKEYGEALHCCERALEIDPQNSVYLKGKEFCLRLIKEQGQISTKIVKYDSQGKISTLNIPSEKYYDKIPVYLQGKSFCLCGAKLFSGKNGQMICLKGHSWFIDPKQIMLVKIFEPANEAAADFHANYFSKRFGNIQNNTEKIKKENPNPNQNEKKGSMPPQYKTDKPGTYQMEHMKTPTDKTKISNEPNKPYISIDGGRSIIRDKIKHMPFGKIKSFEAMAEADLYFKQGKLKERTNDFQGALVAYNKEFEIRNRLVYQEGQDAIASGLAGCCDDRARIYKLLQNNESAVECLSSAIKIYERLYKHEGYSDYAPDLAICYMNKANLLQILGNLKGAIEENDNSIRIYEQLINIDGHNELAERLAKCYLNKGSALINTGNPQAGLESSQKAIELFKQLVFKDERKELFNLLGMSYMNKGCALHYLGDLRKALEIYDTAINLYENEIYKLPMLRKDRHVLVESLADCLMKKASTLHALGNKGEGFKCISKANKIYSNLISMSHL